MEAETHTQRGLSQDHVRQSKEPDPKVCARPLIPNNYFTANGTSVYYFPALVYGSMTELIKVDLSKKQVQCKFQIFVTVQMKLNLQIMAKLRQKQLASKREYDYQGYLQDQLQKLRYFIENNFILECGDKIIDIVNAGEANKQNPQDNREQNEEDDQEDSDDQQDCYWVKMPKLKSQNSVTYQIVGTFKSSFQMHNLCFPYHNIKSALCLKVRQQYFNHMIIRYNLYNFDQTYQGQTQPENVRDEYKIKQFSLKFWETSNSKFGNYKINFCPTTYNASTKTQFFQQLLSIDNPDHSQRENESHKSKIIRETLFNFQIYSYNVPFILRYLVPLLVLCFGSIMMYFADSTQISNTFGNVILIGITLIQQLSNFRTSKYDNTKLNFYQATIFGIIIINFLLVIITTTNFYSQNVSKQANSKSVVYWVAVGIAGLCLLVNATIMIYFKCKVLCSYSWQAQKQEQTKEWNYFWVCNQQLFGNIENEINFAEVPNLMRFKNSDPTQQ